MTRPTPSGDIPVMLAFDRVSDFAYLRLLPEGVRKTADETYLLETDDPPGSGRHIAVEFSADGRIFGIEFGGASKLFDPRLLSG